LRLKGRGSLIPGYFADIVVFDPETIIDTATYAQPHQFAAGINDVLVNGVHTVSNGMALESRGGILLV
jgi:N-acyl-D-aspartate/D-glutamate deacylase